VFQITNSELQELQVKMAVQDVRIFNITEMVSDIKSAIETLSIKFDKNAKSSAERDEKTRRELEYRIDKNLEDLESRLNTRISVLYNWLLGVLATIVSSLVIFFLKKGF